MLSLGSLLSFQKAFSKELGMFARTDTSLSVLLQVCNHPVERCQKVAVHAGEMMLYIVCCLSKKLAHW